MTTNIADIAYSAVTLPNVPAAPRTPLSAEEIRAYLDYNYEGLKTRRDEVVAALSASAAAYPTIGDEDAMGIVTENVALAKALNKTSDGNRVAEKDPYLSGGRAVDAWFKQIADSVGKALLPLQNAMDSYVRIKLQRERAIAAERKAEADRLAQEAAEKALATSKPADWDNAAAAAEDSATAARAANAGAAAMTQTRGHYGAVASARTSWSWEVADINKVPRAYMMLNEAAVKEAARERDPETNKPIAVIPGIAWVENIKAGVR